jgi:hypothetical protein
MNARDQDKFEGFIASLLLEGKIVEQLNLRPELAADERG